MGGTLHLAGSTIANIKNGIDNGNLNITAADITWQDLQNKEYSSSKGFGFSTSIGLGGSQVDAKKAENQTAQSSGGQGSGNSQTPKNIHTGSTTITASRDGHEKEGAAYAAIGQGNITTGSGRDLSSLSRDALNTDVIDKDTITASLDGSLTLDHRLLTADGRAQVVDQMKKLPQNMADAGKGAARGAANVGKAVADSTDNLANFVAGEKGLSETARDIKLQVNTMQADNEFRSRNKALQEIMGDPNSSAEDFLKAAKAKLEVMQKYGLASESAALLAYAKPDDLYRNDKGEWCFRQGSYDQNSDTIGINRSNKYGEITDGKTVSELLAHEGYESKYYAPDKAAAEAIHQKATEAGQYAAQNHDWANWLHGIDNGSNEVVFTTDWLSANASNKDLAFANWFYDMRDGSKTRNTEMTVDMVEFNRPWMVEKDYLPEAAQLWTAAGAGFAEVSTFGLVKINTGKVGEYYDNIGGIEPSPERAELFKERHAFGDTSGKVIGAFSVVGLLKLGYDKTKSSGESQPVDQWSRLRSDKGINNAPAVPKLNVGETATIEGVNVTRVGRWMSPEELATMTETGRVVQGGGGVSFVSTKGTADYMKQAQKGSVYVEYNVPTNSLIQGGNDGWFKLVGPDANPIQQYWLKKQGGDILPSVSDVIIIQKK